MPRKANTRMRKPAKVFVIVAEGSKTEPSYFNIFKNNDYNVKINIVRKGTYSAPKTLLQIMQDELQKDEYSEEHEAWIVCDKDKWPNEQIEEIISWSQEESHYGFALSNTKFELWLLLHFVGEKKAIELLKNSDFSMLGKAYEREKIIDGDKITIAEIKKAVARAKKLRRLNGDSCSKCYSKKGKCYCTDVYKLVKRILKASGQ